MNIRLLFLPFIIVAGCASAAEPKPEPNLVEVDPSAGEEALAALPRASVSPSAASESILDPSQRMATHHIRESIQVTPTVGRFGDPAMGSAAEPALESGAEQVGGVSVMVDVRGVYSPELAAYYHVLNTSTGGSR